MRKIALRLKFSRVGVKRWCGRSRQLERRQELRNSLPAWRLFQRGRRSKNESKPPQYPVLHGGPRALGTTEKVFVCSSRSVLRHNTFDTVDHGFYGEVTGEGRCTLAMRTTALKSNNCQERRRANNSVSVPITSTARFTVRDGPRKVNTNPRSRLTLNAIVRSSNSPSSPCKSACSICVRTGAMASSNSGALTSLSGFDLLSISMVQTGTCAPLSS
jgi:hypothetical protein